MVFMGKDCLKARKSKICYSVLSIVLHCLLSRSCPATLAEQYCGARTPDSQWLSVLPSTVNGTELLAQEYRDALLCQRRSPADLQSHCDGCGQKLSIRHAACLGMQERWSCDL
jgi:hypothetical protein